MYDEIFWSLNRTINNIFHIDYCLSNATQSGIVVKELMFINEKDETSPIELDGYSSIEFIEYSRIDDDLFELGMEIFELVER